MPRNISALKCFIRIFSCGQSTSHVGGLYVAKVEIDGTVISAEIKDPSAGIVARGVSEGDDSLTARMPKDTDKVEVIVASGDLKQSSRSAEVLEANYDSKKRVATLDYPNRFAEGQGIGFIAKDKDGKVIARSEGLLVEPSGYDWGRVKAYFSVGSVLAQNEGKFKNLAPYLRFNMEYNFVPFRNIVPVVVSRENRNVQSEIAHRAYTRTNAVQLQQQASRDRESQGSKSNTGSKAQSGGKTGESPKKNPSQDLFEEALRLKRTWHFALTGYADAQLTENPVATTTTETSKALTFNLRQSPTSGYFEYGLYMPVSAPMMQWTFKNLDNALYVAPLAKFGFMTVNSQVEEGQASSSPKTFAGPGAYKFYAAGFRVGHFAVKNDPGNAPENISFVDLAIGRYGVFRWRKDPNTPGSPEIYPVRVDIRGNFKVPATPFFLGLGANMGAGPDDIRILFGVRMNLAKLFGTVLPKL